MSKVSIVIPCFNAGDYLVEAVESALAQSYADIEVIVVDDGSTDGHTQRVLQSLASSRVQVIHQSNAGPAAARNRAIMEASGEFILPLDADDRFDPSYAEKAVAVIRQQFGVGIVYCDALKFGAQSGIWQLPAYSVREMVIDNVIFCSSMFRKSDWSLVGGYNEKLRHGMEDYEFWIKLIALGRDVIKINEPLFLYRIQEVSRTSRFMDDMATVVATYAEIYRSNADFFAKHANYLFEHRFGLYRELDHFRRRYAKLDRWFESNRLLKAMGRKVHRYL